MDAPKKKPPNRRPLHYARLRAGFGEGVLFADLAAFTAFAGFTVLAFDGLAFAGALLSGTA